MNSFYPDIFLNKNYTIYPWQLHFAASLSSTDNATITEDIHNIVTLQPEIVQYSATTDFNPFHYAVAKNNPNMAVIQKLQTACPTFISIRTCEGDTPLHLSAKHSNSVQLINQLIAGYPEALTMRNENGETPLLVHYDESFS